MKTKFILFLLIILSGGVFAQSVEINPGSSTSSIFTTNATDKGILIPRMTEAQKGLIVGTAGLLIYQTDGTPGFYYHNGTAWTNLGGNGGTASELQKITEGTNTGHRILGRNFANYGDIGNDAIDLSLSSTASATLGATGTNSIAAGDGSTASGNVSTAFGAGTKALGLVSTAFGANTIASGERSIAMGNGTVASGESSTALNHFTTASGQYATSFGLYTTASGQSSTAIGQSSTASGNASVALNQNTTAKSFAETVVGYFNTEYTPLGGTSFFNNADRAFGVGIGVEGGRKDGLIVFKDGTLAFNKLTTAPTTTADRFYVLNNKLNYNGAEVGGASELQKITEGGKTGWRILGRNASKYGDIGINAIDLSLSETASVTSGATGTNSIAAGYESTASGNFSTVLGITSTASGLASAAFGSGTLASGVRSTSIGSLTIASGDVSTAMGNLTTASGTNSTAMGYYSTASGRESTAIGNGSIASGQSSTAIGVGITAKSFGEAVLGLFNTDYTPNSTFNINSNDRAFVVGIGANSSNTKDGLIVYKDGTLAFNKLTTAPATTTDRFYILNNKLNYNGAEVGGASELQKITEVVGETGGTGWRILGRNAANYGNIGDGAIDLSKSSSTSTVRGATGNNSVAMGFNTTASSENSTAMGESTTASAPASTAMGSNTTASGTNSTAMGSFSTASGIRSTTMGSITTASGFAATAMGEGTTAKSYAETSVGSYNTSYTPTSLSSAFDAADRAFGVGIGSAAGSTKDGFVVFKTGNTFISNDGNTPANGTASIIPGFGVGALQVRASGDGFNLRTGTGNNSMNIAKATAPSNGNTYMSFGHIGTGNYTEIGSIKASSSTSISFNTSSDSRLKIDKGIYSKGLSTLNQIKIHDYTWKENKSQDIGVFAQELYGIYPGAVTKGDNKAENDPTKIEKRWQVDYSKLVPVLIAAVQELYKKNETLEQQIASIEKQKVLLTAQLKEMASLKNEIEAIKASLGFGTKTTVSSK